MPLVEIKDFNVLVENKKFFDQPIKNKKEALRNVKKIMTIQKETY